MRTPVFADQDDAFTWYKRERRNLVPLVHTLHERGSDHLAWLLADALYEFYARRNHFNDWIATGTIGLASFRRLGDRRDEAEALENLGKAHAQYGNRARSVEFQALSLTIGQEIGDKRGELASTSALGLAHLRAREPNAALRQFERSREIAEELADAYWTTVTSNNIANALIDLDRPDEAVPLLRETVACYRRLSIAGSEGDALRAG